MKKTYLLFRIGLFSLILSLGVIVALVTGETAGLALADLSNVSVGAMTRTAYGDALYTALSGDDYRNGIYRSEDKGRSWQRISSGPGTAINALAIHPANEDILYAGSVGGASLSDGSLWVSDDQGHTWDPYRLRLPASVKRQLPPVSVLAVDPHHPGLLYVGTEGQGLYRFFTGDEGYELIGGTALRGLYVKNIVVVPGGPIYALTTGGLIAVNGDAWRRIDTLPDLAVSLAVDPADSQTLYAGTVSSGAYRSEDGGQTWQAINASLGLKPGVILRVSAITVDEKESSHLALSTAYSVGKQLAGGGIYESVDAGKSWIKLGDAQEVVNHLVIKEGGVYAAAATGLVRYGEVLSAATLASRLQTHLLANPTGMQVFILALAVALGGWVLLGRATWVLKRVRIRVV